MAGGHATASGIRFQENVATWFSVLILAEENAPSLAGLPSTITYEFLLAESVQPTDDLNVGTSAGGRLFIQAKTALSLSTDTDSEFGKAIDQFLGQYLLGCPDDDGQQRELDISRDRFVLAVSENAPATIRNQLRSLLDRMRSATAGTVTEVHRALSGNDRSVYDTLKSVFQDVWANHGTGVWTDEDFLGFIQFVHVLPLDFSVNGSTTRELDHVLRTSVLFEATQASVAKDTLLGFCRNLSPERTGADREHLRSVLEKAGVALSPPRSYHDDIAKAKEYTRDRLQYLQKMSVISFGDASNGEIKINRTASTELAEMAENGNVLVVGQPGAGKSGCIHDLAALLEKDRDVLLIPVDRLGTPSAISSDLGLSRSNSLADLLSNWSGEGNAFLFIDALDAARTHGSLQRLCEDLEDVMRRAPRWRVVVSIREFDLQHSRDARRLFAGQPHDELCDPRFGDIRHIQIRQLSDDELAQVREQAPALATVLETVGEALRSLARNPFNLRLLAELVECAVDVSVLATVTAQIELLGLYWEQRVYAPEGEVGLRRDHLSQIIEMMVKDRQLRVSKSAVDSSTEEKARCLDRLLSDRVLVESDQVIADAESQIGFAHNILFDYAVARLWLKSVERPTIEQLSGDQDSDLLLAIRPSIDMAFQRLWYEARQVDKSTFWDRTFAFQQTRLVGRIIPASVAARAFRRIDDLQPLLDGLQREREHASSIVSHLITAAVMLDDDRGNEFQLLGPAAAPWMELAAQLATTSIHASAWQVRVLIARTLRAEKHLTGEQREFSGHAARCLLKHVLDESSARGAMPIAVHVVSQTLDTNVVDSIALLSRLLESDELAISGHQTLDDMAEHFAHLAACDAEFACLLAATIFSTYASRDEQVPMGSRILPLTFNKHDMLDMARHHIAEAFPAVMRDNPALGTRIAGIVLDRHYANEHSDSIAEKLCDFSFGDSTGSIRCDHSHIGWGRDYVSHQNWWKVLCALRTGLCEVARTAPEDLERVIQSFCKHFELAAGWRILLEAASEAPEALGTAISDLLTIPAILAEDDTRLAAGRCIENVYPHLSREKRAVIERVIMTLDTYHDEEIDVEYRARVRDRMLGCIPADLIESDAARARLQELEADGPPRNSPSVSMTGFRTVSEDELLVSDGVDVAAPQNQEIRRLTQLIKEFVPSHDEKTFTVAQVSEFFPTIREVDSVLDQWAERSIDPRLAESAREHLIECCERMASTEGLTASHELYQYIRQKLLDAANDPGPEWCEDEGERWDSDMPAWSSPSPRISAAVGLMALAHRPETVDGEILAAIEALATDPHPAVRYQVACRCLMLWHTNRDLAWLLIDRIASTEQSFGVLSFFIHYVLLRLGSHDIERGENLIRMIYRRTRRSEKAGKIREQCAVFYFRRALWESDPKNERRIDTYARSPLHFKDEVQQLVQLCRGLLVFDDDERSESENGRVRMWAIQFLQMVLESILREVRSIQGRRQSADEWTDKDIAAIRVLHSLADSIGHQVYFASGAFDDKKGDETPLTHQQLERFAQEVDPLLDRLCEVEFVGIAYDVLKTLEYLAPIQPVRVFHLVGKVVSHASRDGIQYESLATDLVVAIVERYLADRRGLFRLDSELRNILLDVLDVFVEAGWSSATRLTFRLSEVFR